MARGLPSPKGGGGVRHLWGEKPTRKPDRPTFAHGQDRDRETAALLAAWSLLGLAMVITLIGIIQYLPVLLDWRTP